MIYVAFLQGINQGKHYRIKMADLRIILERRGLKKVQTYSQNGNVLFESDYEEEFITKMIEREIMIIYNYVVPVVIRKLDELEVAIKSCPFPKEKIKEAEKATGEKLYIAFLKNPVTDEKSEALKEYEEKDTLYEIKGREVYLLFFHYTLPFSNLVKNLYRLDIHVCVRNLPTLKKLISLGKEMID